MIVVCSWKIDASNASSEELPALVMKATAKGRTPMMKTMANALNWMAFSRRFPFLAIMIPPHGQFCATQS